MDRSFKKDRFGRSLINIEKTFSKIKKEKEKDLIMQLEHDNIKIYSISRLKSITNIQ